MGLELIIGVREPIIRRDFGISRGNRLMQSLLGQVKQLLGDSVCDINLSYDKNNPARLNEVVVDDGYGVRGYIRYIPPMHKDSLEWQGHLQAVFYVDDCKGLKYYAPLERIVHKWERFA